MAEFPALPLWTDAYLGDTTHLTTIEHGAYLLLLMTAWRSSECRLADDDRLLARYTRTTLGQWKRLRPILEPFFKVRGGFWMQSRLTDEAVAVRQKKDAAAANGRASALKRKGRHSTERVVPLNEATNEASTKNQLNQNQNHSSLDKSNDEVGQLPNPEQIMFDHGLAILASAGVPEAKARPILGKWKRDYGAADVIVALGAAQREGAIEPVSYITAALKARVGSTAQPRLGSLC